MNGIIGKKLGMTSIFDDAGRNIPCTVIEARPNIVTQVKSVETDGYAGVQLGYGEKKAKNMSAALLGHLKKSGAQTVEKLVEFQLSIQKSVGEHVSAAELFQEGDKVNVIGTSKGKGFQGVIKRHGFSGVGDQTHGQHNRLRAPGSVGASSFPSKVVKGLRMAGQTGNSRVKTKNLRVVRILSDQNLILIKGCIPGHKGSFVIIEK